MKAGTSKKILIGILIVLIASLIGVSIFIATRLQESQAPSSSSAADCKWTTSDNCGSFCSDYLIDHPQCCGDGGNPASGTGKVCPDQGGPGDPTKPNECNIIYAGDTMNVNSQCANKGVFQSTTSYDGKQSKCPTTEGYHQIGTVGSNGGQYTAIAAPGTCTQIDIGGIGGVCSCTPPNQTPQNSCEKLTLENPTSTPVTVNPGQTVTIKGWAQDKDGFNSIQVLVNNVAVGNATLTPVVCGNGPSNNSDPLCQQGIRENAYRYTYNYVVPSTATNNSAITISVKGTDKANLTGASCQGQGTLKVSVTETPAPTVSAASACPTGSTSPTATITWNPSTTIPANIDIDNDNNWSNGYWKKINLSGSSTNAPSGFTGVNGASGSLTLTSTNTYYVRAYYYKTDTFSQVATFTAAQCQIQLQCISLTENGSDPVASGTGQYVEYTLTYQNPATSDPYPNIRLRVGTTASPVGRDATNTSSALVKPFNITNDSVNHTYTYKFRWEAASTSGSAVTAGTYNVRAMLDGTNATEISTPNACTESITISQTAVEEPLFTILKESAPFCETGGDSVINYKVTIKNIGSVPGTIDFVQDTYDTQVYGLNILPTNITPSYGLINTGKITWTGDNTQRTYSAGQSREFTYTIRIPKDNLTTFSTTGLYNQAVVQYDTSTTNNNTASFDLRTLLTCTITIPNTGILDDYKFILVGTLFIIMGLLVFRFRIGNELSLFILEKSSSILNNRKVKSKNKVRPYEESIMDDFERKNS